MRNAFCPGVGSGRSARALSRALVVLAPRSGSSSASDKLRGRKGPVDRRVEVEGDGPGKGVVVVLAHRHRSRFELDTLSGQPADVIPLLLAELPLGEDGHVHVRRFLVFGPIHPGVLGLPELSPLRPDRIESLERLEKGGLAALVLPHQAGEVPDREPIRVEHRLEVGDADPLELHERTVPVADAEHNSVERTAMTQVSARARGSLNPAGQRGQPDTVCRTTSRNPARTRMRNPQCSRGP